MRKQTAAGRFQIGDYFLCRPHPEHGGSWYAARYDARTRTTRRRSLGTDDENEAKEKLAAIALASPKASAAGAAPAPGEVLTLTALAAYLDERGSLIASEEQADRAVDLFAAFLTSIDRIDAAVAFWTPSQQLACARWLNGTFGHSAGYIERLFNVLRAAFVDATRVRIRADGTGIESETALIASAPIIGMKRAEIASELRILPQQPRRKTLSLEQMARVLDAATTPHLRRFAIMALCTWARPQAVIDFDPAEQTDWNTLAIDLAPVNWRPTKKRRPQQPMTQTLADWLLAWRQEDGRHRERDRAAGLASCPDALLIYKRKRVATTKRAWRRIGAELALDGFSQKHFRHFMTDQVKNLFRIPREHRSRWLGHVVRDGSRTTDHYEGDDPMELMDVALAVDCIMALLAERCQRPLLAIDRRLTEADLRPIGARVMPKNVVKSSRNGGRDRDRTCDPYRVEVDRFADVPGKSAKRRA